MLLYIDEGASLTVTGANANGSGVGRAAILLPEGSTLTIAGAGTLTATGGNAGRGETGFGAEGSDYNGSRHSSQASLQPRPLRAHGLR